LQAPPGECSIRLAIIKPSEISFLRFVLEAYEGLAVLSTIDAGIGLVQISIAPGCEEDVELILQAEAVGLGLRSISEGPTPLAKPGIIG
jgi:hypothetical protein